MKSKKIELDIDGQTFVLVVTSSPESLADTDTHREVFFKDPEKGWIYGVFFCYPTSVKRKRWQTPVDWSDPAMLYVPDLRDATILNAVSYLYKHGMMSKTFEACPEPDEVFPTVRKAPQSVIESLADKTDANIKQSIFGILVQFKHLGLGSTRAELLQLIREYTEDVMDSRTSKGDEGNFESTR